MTEADDLRRALPPLDDGPGPARRLSDAETAAFVGNVMAAWEGPPTPNEGPTPSAPNGGTASPAASKLLRFGLGGFALVAFGIGLGVVAMRQPEPTPSAVATIGPIELLDAAAPELSATSERSETIEIDDEGDEPRRVRRRRPRVQPDPAPVMVAETADDLLRRANALRGAGSYREAERTYLEVTSAHPSTHAAYVARVAAAALRLEHLGDPGGAVRLYRSAIVHGGALDAEARAGLARAYARLGRDAEEAEAWRGLLARHPSSPFAGRARSRLAELEAAP
jgi:tetratricopeptide (TPR) repeat protein